LTRSIEFIKRIASLASTFPGRPLPLTRPERVDWNSSLNLQTVKVRNYRLSYTVKGEGEALILIHGYGAGMWIWEKQIDVLSQFYRVYLLDLIGHGFSDRPRIDYSPETYIHCLKDFMEGVGIGRATLIGNSMGGGVAWAVAGHYPERVERLVLIDCVTPDVLNQVRNLSFRALAAIINVPVLSRLVFWGVSKRSVGRVLHDCFFDLGHVTPQLVERQYQISNIEGTSWVLYSTFKHAKEALRLEKCLSRIYHPTLLLWGEEDRIFTPAVGESLQKKIPGSRLRIIKKTGHIPMWESPGEVNQVILNFLKEA
jgi:pimeloyl-ACP methyl ester carboxylesterase